MSEVEPGSAAIAKPDARVRWMFLVIIALTTRGGTYWWTNRLTPDEQIIVGRWEVVISFLGSSQTIKHIAEYRDDRTEYSGGIMTHWTAKNGLIRILI